jgi:hypothetical protein
VAIHCTLIVAEALVLWLVLTQLKGSLLARAFVCACATGLVAATARFQLSLHAPPWETYHVLWLICVTAATAVTGLVAGVARVLRARPGP